MASGSNRRAFASCYTELCKQQRLRPLPVINVGLPQSLDFATDRVKMDDWGPILHSLSLDQTLSSIAVRSRYQSRRPLEEVNSADKARALGKTPVVLTRFLLEWLSQSLAQCLRNSSALTRLELDGIPLPPDCVAVLCVGLSSTNTLSQLSLQRCRVGDSSCELICRTVADVRSVKILNLSQCELTSRSGAALAAALSRQKLALYHETWKESLRYRVPDLEVMPGLRRITLNGNPRLGDIAAIQIAEAVRDSLWLKALDLRSCGLTDEAGYEFLTVLNANPTLVVIDLRLNAVAEEILGEIGEKLGADRDDVLSSEYPWMPLPQKNKPPVPSEVKNQRRPNVGRGFAPKNVIPRSRSTVNRSQPKRPCRQAAPVIGRAATASADTGRGIATAKNEKVEEKVVRTSLHIDLRPGIEAENIVEDSDRESIKDSSSAVGTLKVEEVLRQLIEAKAQHEQLLEETKRTGLLLEEEKLRREKAEAKLTAMKENLADLETALKTKEEETRGYILVSQQSLDDICTAFDRLIEMLDTLARNPATRNGNFDEGIVAREKIKRQLAHLIRKTKSESLNRGRVSPTVNVEPERTFARKSTRSEADIRTTLTPVLKPMIHLETRIGDSPDLASPTRETNRFSQDPKLSDSPEERARAIFEQIVREGSILTIG